VAAHNAISDQNIDGQNTKGQVKLIAYYLTQFHPIPENDLWWGRGFTEWTNVTKSRPMFRGHYQPHLPADFGFYDLRVGETRRDQIALAKSCGIDGFCYYYYWFSGKRLLQRPLEDMLADPASDMPFCLCWANENWTRGWDAAEHEILIAQKYGPDDDLNFIKSLIPYFQDPRYIRFEGAPLLIVYRPQHLPDARRSAQIWRDYCRSVGIPKIQVYCAFTHDNWRYEQFGFDGGVEFPPHNMAQQDLRGYLDCFDGYEGYVFDCTEVAEMYLARDYSAYNAFRTVFTSWDNSSRRGRLSSIGLNGTPENYEYWLSRAIERTKIEYPAQERLVFINAWNEWAEGCHLEPDRKYGHKFLEATARAKREESVFSSWTHVGVPIELKRETKTHVGIPVESEKIERGKKAAFRRALEDPLALFHPKLTAQRDSLISQRDELMAQKDLLVCKCDELRAQRDLLISQYDELMAHRDSLIFQYQELTSERDLLLSQTNEETARYQELMGHYETQTARYHEATAKKDLLISEVAALSGAAAARDRLALQLAAFADNGGQGVADLVSLSKSVEGLRALYLDLMESVLIGAVYEDPPFPIFFGWKQFDPNIRNRGGDWPKNAFSMIGAARMRNFRVLTERVISSNVQGDIVETGVWRGGASILARAVLAAYGVHDRRVILADSFEGLPPPDKDRYPADEGSILHDYSELAVSAEKVRSNFEKFRLFDDQVVLLKGWFKDTMPVFPSNRIAILRLDGDLYESTIIPLMYLFDKVSVGGWIIVDDYGCIPGCKLAVQDFLSERGLSPELHQIDGVGVFFEKTARDSAYSLALEGELRQ